MVIHDRGRERGLLTLRTIIPLLVLSAAALQIPVYPQGAPPPLSLEDVQKQAKTRAILDGVDTAEGQQRLPLYRLQHKSEPDLIAKAEKAQADTLKQMRAKWLAPPLRLAFETAYRRTLADPSYRARALLFADKPDLATDPPPSSFDPFMLIGYVVVIGGIVVVFGGILGGWFRTSNIPKPPLKLGRGGEQQPQQPEQTSDTFGSAGFAEPRKTIADDLYPFNGVFFGKSSEPGAAETAPLEQHQGAPICSTPENHTLIVARTRTGKGTRVVIPTLLRYINSCIVVDPKGELACVTARARASAPFNQAIHIINPWNELKDAFAERGLPYATYNPLDILDLNDPNVVATARSLAASICPREKGVTEAAYWSHSAASMLTAVLLWLTDQPGETKTLGRAREILTRSRKDFTQDHLTDMAASSAFEGAIREFAAPFIDLADETYSSVVSNLAQYTSFLSDPPIKHATATSTFSMRDIMTTLSTLYLVIPPDQMDIQRTWLRLMITAGMQTYKRRPSGVKIHRCMFLIDELPALGVIPEMPPRPRHHERLWGGFRSHRAGPRPAERRLW